ncbi:MAG: hypothetical protein ACQEXJ_00520 [Myxococcota bacterium]
MSAQSTNDELSQDVRIIRRRLAKGFVTPEKIDEMLADLPDVADQGEWFDPTAEDASARAAAAEETD